MRVFHTDDFPLDLPPGHRFPQAKYRLLRERVATDPETAPHAELTVAGEATDDELLLVHDRAYVTGFRNGTLPPDHQRRIGFPWSPSLVRRSLRSCGATIAAARTAVADRAAIYLGGGTHHAFRDGGSGYCVFNDCAVATRVVFRESAIERVLIVDLDVHQGDGTAAILAGEPRAFTLSLHGERNYPRLKMTSDLDIALPDGTGDDDYLRALDGALARAIALARPDLVFYLAGADPYAGDKLGRLALSKAGLAARDRRVLTTCDEVGARLVVVMAGGYARDVQDTVDIHFETVRRILLRTASRTRVRV